MQWKEALYTLNSKGVFTLEETESLTKLPRLRDEIFFSDYTKYGYIGIESNLNIVNSFFEMYSVDIPPLV